MSYEVQEIFEKKTKEYDDKIAEIKQQYSLLNFYYQTWKQMNTEDVSIDDKRDFIVRALLGLNNVDEWAETKWNNKFSYNLDLLQIIKYSKGVDFELKELYINKIMKFFYDEGKDHFHDYHNYYGPVYVKGYCGDDIDENKIYTIEDIEKFISEGKLLLTSKTCYDKNRVLSDNGYDQLDEKLKNHEPIEMGDVTYTPDLNISIFDNEDDKTIVRMKRILNDAYVIWSDEYHILDDNIIKMESMINGFTVNSYKVMENEFICSMFRLKKEFNKLLKEKDKELSDILIEAKKSIKRQTEQIVKDRIYITSMTKEIAKRSKDEDLEIMDK